MTRNVGLPWLKSLGGPLIAVPRSVVAQWQGSDGPGDEDDLDELDDPDDVDEEDTDYWRACLVVAEAGVIGVAGKEALVLKTPSVPTVYVPEHRMFVHEMAKTRTADVVTAVSGAIEGYPWRRVATFQVSEPLVLFDSSLPGDYALGHDFVPIQLPGGTYGVDVAYHEPGSPEDVWVTLVRLVI